MQTQELNSTLRRPRQVIERTSFLKRGALVSTGIVASILIILFWMTSSRHTIYVEMLAVLLILLLAPAVTAIARKVFDPFEPLYLFCAVYFIYFWLTPVYFLTLVGESYVDFHPVQLEVMGLTIIGLVTFYAGYYSGFIRRIRVVPRVKAASNSINGALFTLGIFLIAVACAYIFFRINGVSLYAFIFEIARGEKYYYQGRAVYSSAIMGLLDVVAVMGGYLLMALKIHNFLLRIVLYFVVAFSSLFLFIWSGSRIHAVLILFAWLIQYHYLRKRIGLLVLATIATVLLLFSFMALEIRSFLPRTGVSSAVVVAQEEAANLRDFLATTYYSGDLDFYKNFTAVVSDMPRRMNYLYGLSYYKVLFAPIPRDFWPSKPEATPRIFVKYWYPLRYDLGYSAGPGILGEAYMNFGMIGVPLMLFLFGLMYRYFYVFIERNAFNGSSVLIYSATWFVLIFNNLRGDFEISVILALMWGVTAWVGTRVMRPKPRGLPADSWKGGPYARRARTLNG